MTQWKSGFVPEHLHDAYRRQALYDIRQKTDFLASLNDGRNVEGFSAMRATGKYVTHHIVSEDEFTSLYYQAYLRNGLLRKIGRNSFIKSVRRALDGCTRDALPGLNRVFMNEEATTCQQLLPVPKAYLAGVRAQGTVTRRFITDLRKPLKSLIVNI